MIEETPMIPLHTQFHSFLFIKFIIILKKYIFQIIVINYIKTTTRTNPQNNNNKTVRRYRMESFTVSYFEYFENNYLPNSNYYVLQKGRVVCDNHKHVS